MTGLKKFLISLIVLSLFLAAAGFFVFRQFFPVWYFDFFPWLILLFLIVNSGFIAFFFRYLHRSNREFIRGFMVSTGLKLVIYLALVLVYVLTSPKSAISFSVTASVLYIIYTAFDLYIMLSVLKRKKEKKSMTNQLSN